MDIYKKNSVWRILLVIAAIILVGVTVVYTNRIASRLKASEKKSVELWAQAIKKLSSDPLSTDLTFGLQVIQSNDIPAIITDYKGKILQYANLDSLKIVSDTGYLQSELIVMKGTHDPVIIDLTSRGLPQDRQYVYYKNTRWLTVLNYFPWIQALLIGMFVSIGYMVITQARRSEQNQVWVGMAKETAHQLGTPISSIVAWIEHLKITTEGDDDSQQILKEMRKDLGRLELIAERFSKIGSKPKLEATNIYQQLEKNFTYMNRRASKRIKFDLKFDPNEANVNINPPLFDWVIENLLKNALDAMGNEGTIQGEVFFDEKFIHIDISDTGKGIPSSKIKTVFQPGFTTKKRGWGLGLSLTKRIIENYHSGRIFVKKSIINEGTTFRVSLPRYNQ